jgi:hypothetical protein
MLNNNNFNRAFFAQNNSQMTKLQELINNASDAVMCGPTCQKIRKTEELERNYIDAQTNVISAPDKLKQSQKDFFLFSQGVAKYDEMIDNELTNKANKIAEVIQSEFNDNIKNAQSLTANYATLKGQDEYMQDLKEKYTEENAELSSEIKDIFNDIVTNDRKTYYQDQNITRSYAWYNLYIVIFIILIILFLIFIVLADSKYSYKVKIPVFIIFCAYPWISGPITFWLIGSFQHISDLLPKNIYKSL